MELSGRRVEVDGKEWKVGESELKVSIGGWRGVELGLR